jgi:alcohol dehydrogenase (cytochrome c)
MKHFWVKAGVAVVVLGILGGVGSILFMDFYPQDVPVEIDRLGGEAIEEVRTLNAPKGTLTTTTNDAYEVTSDAATTPADPALTDWPLYNRTLEGDRYSPLSEITTKNVGNLKVLCTYDTDVLTSFESGLVVVNGALIGTTEHDTFSLDPSTCAENWRVHEEFPPSILGVNRGVAFLDGTLFRGLQDGRVVAYDFETGKKLWETTIADSAIGESVPAAPVAWDGMVWIGQAGGDYKGVKGRMYGLDAKTGEIVWEFYLLPYQEGDKVRGPLVKNPLTGESWKNKPGIPISGGATWTHYTIDTASGEIFIPGGNPAPDYDIMVREGDNLYAGSVVVLDAKTGEYQYHYEITGRDWHDWDVSNAPILIESRGGKHMLIVTPKDGHVYGFDRATGERLYKVPVTTMKNVDVPFEVGKPVRFCPGPVGGAEWNSAAYVPTTNLILIGEVDWCYEVTMSDTKELETAPVGAPWMGQATLNPLYSLGEPIHGDDDWHGWVYAVDADTGEWAWRAKLNYPVVSGMTPTAGGVVFFGDVGGNFYALDSTTGEKLWRKELDGGIGGGVITYMDKGTQKVALAAGFTSPVWPTKQTNAKVYVLGLDDPTAQ